MDSPLSIFSPDSYGYLNDEYTHSPSSFGCFSASAGEDSSTASSSVYSFASLSGLAEQLCEPPRSSTPSHTPYTTTNYYNPAQASTSSASPQSMDDFFSFDTNPSQAEFDFSSSSDDQDDFFTPTFSVTDLPHSPTPYSSTYRAGCAPSDYSSSDHYPSTPSPPSFSLAPALKTTTTSDEPTVSLSAVHEQHDSWAQELCVPADVFFPVTQGGGGQAELDDQAGGDCWWVEQPQQKLSNKLSMESLGEWDGVESAPQGWETDEAFFSSVPTWLSAPAPTPSPVSIHTPLPATPSHTHRTPRHARSVPQIIPSAPRARSRLPAKSSHPALALRQREDALTTAQNNDADYSYIFDGGASPHGATAAGNNMFAVLGGYGGEARNLASEWEDRTVGSEMYGGNGWEAGAGQRFDAEFAPSQQQPGQGVMATRLMAGFEQHQQARMVSSSSAKQSAAHLVTPPRSHRRPQAPPSSATTPSSSSTLLSSGPLPTRAARKISPLPTSSSTNPPAHLARAQSITALRHATLTAERAQLRATASARKVDPFLASVLIQGWEPLPESEAAQIVAPPPARPIARLPSHSPAKPSPARPIARLPSSSSSSLVRTAHTHIQQVQRPAIEAPKPAGGLSYTTFINYTMDDAESLLMGVAPSGAPQPRKTSAPSPVLKHKATGGKRKGEEIEGQGQGKRRAT